MSRGRPWSALAALAAGALALRPAGAAAQWQKNEYQQQKELAAKFEPAPLEAPVPEGGQRRPITPLRIRFYSDGDYRAGGPGAQARILGQLAEMNRLVGPSFGVRFEAESFRPWNRRSGAGALAPMLDELERLDPAVDVDWVVGLVSPLPLVSMSFHDLGTARVLGRHFVLRGMTSVAEMQEFERIFRALDRADREKLYGRRKAHKEMAVFLHEWAHTLGTMHVQGDPSRIMGPGYSQRTGRLSADDARFIATALDARLRARGRPVDWAALAELVRSSPDPGWPPNERQQLLGLIAQGGVPGGSGSAGATAGAPADLPVPLPPPGKRPLFPRPASAPAAALPEAAPPPPAPVPAVRPRGAGASARADLLTGECEQWLNRGQPREAARRCTRAVAADKNHARAHYLLGLAQSGLGDSEKALASLRRSIVLDPRQPHVWQALGQLYRELGRSREFQRFIAEQGGASEAR